MEVFQEFWDWFRRLPIGKKILYIFGGWMLLSAAMSWNVILTTSNYKPSGVTMAGYGAVAYAALLLAGTYFTFFRKQHVGHVITLIKQGHHPYAPMWAAWSKATQQVGVLVLVMLALCLVGLTVGTSPLVVTVVALVHRVQFMKILRGEDMTPPPPKQRDAVGPVADDLRDLFPQADRVALQETEAAAMAQPAPRSIYDDDDDDAGASWVGSKK